MILSTSRNHLWSAFFALLLSVVFMVAAFWDTDAEVYLFPRIATSFMLLLALAQWADIVISTLRKQHADPASPASSFVWSTLLPGLITGIGYVLIMEQLGFYSSSFLAFVIITSLYGKRKALDVKALIYKVMVGLIFVAILYGLFWELLNVRTPTGILF